MMIAPAAPIAAMTATNTGEKSRTMIPSSTARSKTAGSRVAFRRPRNSMRVPANSGIDCRDRPSGPPWIQSSVILARVNRISLRETAG